jgi:amidase
MPVKPPTPDQLRQLAQRFNLHLSDAELNEYLDLISATADAYNVVDALPDYLPAVKYPRSAGYQPYGDDNQYNAWYVKTTINGAPSGKLAGKTIVLKDNICLAGVPMMVGASSLEGYVPDVDATIVTRMLDAGGKILGKAHCEYFCLSGSSNTGAKGPVHNPWKHGYSAGGSSSGSAVLVSTGEADMAIGGDQGGSIRIPAALCGIVGMKPSYGLVPYTGVMPIELTIDHIGPMTRSVADNALLLEVLAGEDDGLDPRQYAPRTAPYTQAIGQDIKGLKIGIVEEGFAHTNSDREVDELVRDRAAVFEELGASVETFSLPMHAQGKAIWTPIGLEGLTELMMKGNGYGTNARGLFVTSLIDAHSHWREHTDEFSVTLKFALLAGEYYGQLYHHLFYAKAQNQSRKLRAEYETALQRYDVLLMPSVPLRATPMPPAEASIKQVVEHALGFNANCIPTNLTGHPALSIPCGLSDGLPVGLMLIGRHYDESMLYRVAHAFEQAVDWKTRTSKLA